MAISSLWELYKPQGIVDCRVTDILFARSFVIFQAKDTIKLALMTASFTRMTIGVFIQQLVY